MAIRLSGLNSGLDTDSIVSALVSAYNYKKDTYVKEQTKLSWTQEIWKNLNTKVYSLYTNISNLRFSSAYNLKKTTSSDTTKATVTAGNDAVNGSQKLNILQLAQSGYVTGGKLATGTKTSSTLAELGYTGGTASINVDRGDGTSSTIEVKSTSTISDVIEQLKSAGLNASLDTTNNRIFVSAKASGAEADFNLIGVDANGVAALEKLGLSTSLVSTGADGSEALTAAGEAYQKYAQYAVYTTGPDGNQVFDEEQTRRNIEDAIAAYGNASDTYDAATEQLANLTSALAYGVSYSNAQDFYAKYGIGEDDQARFNSVMMNSSSGSSLVDADGNIYKAISSKDEDGDTVYRYTDADGNQTLISREVTYTLDGETYKKNAKGKYVNEDGEEFTGDTTDLVKDENMQVNYYKTEENILYKAPAKNGEEAQTFNDKDLVAVQYVDGETGETGEHYVITLGGTNYVCETKTGTFVNQDDPKDTLKLTKSYSYEKLDGVTGFATVSEAYDEYKDLLLNDGMEEDEAKASLTSLTADIKRVDTFENNAAKEAAGDEESDEEADPDYYSKTNIVEQVHNAYNTGKLDTSTSGAEAVDNLITSYANKIADFKADADDAQNVMDANQAVASLSQIEDEDELKQAVDNFVSAVQNAANVLANPTAGAAVKVDGQDAIIKLNGVEYTNSTNSIQVNGLTINAQGITGDGDENAITITTATDTQGIYDTIKDFLTEYNNVINEMTKLYNASSARGYEPLTDDEKDAMSDSEIEKWETKIKDSLLRSDSTLNGIVSIMTRAMSSAIEINGKKYSLSSFGISTLGYLNAAENEYNAYHIDGDEDDANTSSNKDKLMAAIESDPDAVMEFFQKLTTNLYNALGDKMKSTSLSSSYTIYNDKQYTNQYKEYSKTIAEWEERISTKEDYYYQKFAAMESALAKLNSTQSAMGGFFG